MQYQIVSQEEVATLRIEGTIDVSVAAELYQRCQELLAAHTSVTIDVSAVEFMDVAAAQVLIALHRELNTAVKVHLPADEQALSAIRQVGLEGLLLS